MNILDHMAQYGHEQLVYCQDANVGLRAIICVHDTTLGPALGGARMYPYASEEEATLDALRLARAMTFKAAAAGLGLGGGKAVIIGDPHRDKSEALFRALGRQIEALGGRYYTTEDVGTSVRDMEWVREETRFVTGLPLEQGFSGDPSPATALGVWQGMKAAAKEVFGSDALSGLTIAVQGVGKVGCALARYLHEEGAKLIVTDANEASAKRARQDFDADLIAPDRIYDVDCDILSPNALGAVLNPNTIPRLRCRLVAGAANNQLLSEEDGEELHRRGILYAPDYVLNAGGIINLSYELTRYSAELAQARVRRIYETVEKLIALARSQGVSMARAADRMAEERLSAARSVKTLYLQH